MIDFAALVSRSSGGVTSSSTAEEGNASVAPACCPDKASDTDGIEATALPISSTPSVPHDETTVDHRVTLLLRQIVHEGRDLVVDEQGRLTISPIDSTIAVNLNKLQESLLSACAAAGVSFGDIGEDAECAARAILQNYEVEPVPVTSNSTAAEVVSVLSDLPDDTMIGVDTETCPLLQHRGPHRIIRLTKAGSIAVLQPSMSCGPSLDPHRAEIRTVQLWWGGSKAYVFDMASKISGRGGVSWSVLGPLWARRLVMYNATFDCKFLLASGIEPREVLDPMLAAGLVTRGEPNWRKDGNRRPSLAVGAREILELDVPKAGQTSNWSRSPLTAAQVAYAALDAVLARLIALESFTRMGTRQQQCWRRASMAVPAAAAIELAGIAVDRTRHVQTARNWQDRLDALTTKVQEATGIEKPRSGPQVAAWLKTTLPADALAAWPRTQKGALSTKSKHLRRVRHLHPGFSLLADWNQLAQRVSTFGYPLLERLSPVTGRLHANLNVAQAKSGRFSSSSPNFQNMPRYSTEDPLRESFVAPDGRVLIVADYSQLELRCIAAEAEDKAMTAAFDSGEDLHAVTACALLGIEPIKFDKKDPTHTSARQKAKAINFGIVYGSGAAGLAEFARDAFDVQMSLEEAETAIATFKAHYRQVAVWQDRQRQVTALTRAVRTRGGRLYSFDWESRGKYNGRLALNLPIQGAAAEIAQEALARAYVVFRDLLGRPTLVGQVHDEFLVEVDDEAKAISNAETALEQAMVRGFQAIYPDAPTTELVAMAHGRSWAEAK